LIGAVTRAQILEFRSHLASVRGRRPGTKLSPARINTIMLILRQILQEAADRHEFTMPMGRIKPLKVPKSDVQPFSLEQTQLLIRTIRKDYQNYLKVRLFTGMRSGEIHGLKWKYVDFERRLILVRETLVGGEEEYTKNDFSQRDIPMSQVVSEALLAQHKATGKMDYVFCNRAGEPVDTNNFTKRVWYGLQTPHGRGLQTQRIGMFRADVDAATQCNWASTFTQLTTLRRVADILKPPLRGTSRQPRPPPDWAASVHSPPPSDRPPAARPWPPTSPGRPPWATPGAHPR
jgi:integrase